MRAFVLLVIAALAPPFMPSARAELGILSRARDVVGDSEFALGFPEEKHTAAVRVISARCVRSAAEGAAHSAHKQLMAGKFSVKDYQSLIEMIRQLDDSALSSSIPEGCQEPYNLKIRVGTQRRTYVGCRDATPNATLISRIYKKLEFLLINGAQGR